MNIIFKPECKTEIIEPTYDLPIIGEPISKTGASANNSNAYGVIVGIIGDGSSRRVRVMTEGYIDYDKVKENYMAYTDEAINALTGITLCSGGKLPTGGVCDMKIHYIRSSNSFELLRGTYYDLVSKFKRDIIPTILLIDETNQSTMIYPIATPNYRQSIGYIQCIGDGIIFNIYSDNRIELSD